MGVKVSRLLVGALLAIAMVPAGAVAAEREVPKQEVAPPVPVAPVVERAPARKTKALVLKRETVRRLDGDRGRVPNLKSLTWTMSTHGCDVC